MVQSARERKAGDFYLFPPGGAYSPNVTASTLRIAFVFVNSGRPGSSEVPRNPLTRWDVSSIPANGISLTKKLKN